MSLEPREIDDELEEHVNAGLRAKLQLRDVNELLAELRVANDDEAPNQTRFEAWLRTRLGRDTLRKLASSSSKVQSLRAAFMAGAGWRKGAGDE